MGIDQIPTVHEGPAVRQMEKKGIVTEKGDWNKFIKATNRMIAATSKKLLELGSWIAALKTELSKPQSPALALLLNNYYDQRNAGAWSKKARLSNLKSHAEAVAFLKEHGIVTLDDLSATITAAQEKSGLLKESMQESGTHMKKLAELLRMAQHYREGKPIYDEMNTHKFKKAREKYAAQHENQLRLFYMAQRKLKPYFMESDKLPVQTWRDQLSHLQQEYEADKAEYSKIYHDTQALMDIRRCVDQAMNDEPEKQPTYHRQEHDIE